MATTVSAMCPTHQVTGEERDGTRGRARAILELFTGTLTTAEALESLDTCLSCKACATDCPTGVDIATYKSELLHEHHQTTRRPARHFILGGLPRLTALARPVAPLVNAVLASSVGRRVMTRFGLTDQRP